MRLESDRQVCQSKKKFFTRKAAKRKGLYTYKCKVCGKWHQTSTPRLKRLR